MTLTHEPPLRLCSADHQRKEWLDKENQKRLTDFACYAASGVLLSFVAIKPLNAVAEWVWRLAALPNVDSKTVTVPLSIDVEIDKPVKEGDVILGYEVTSGFGDRIHPVTGEKAMHQGVDLATPEGTPLYLIGKNLGDNGHTGYADVFCDNNLFGANNEGIAAYVTIPNYPDMEFAFWHLKSCSSGRLPIGSKFAETGNTGRSTGAHLHYGVRVKGQWIEPTTGALRWFLEGKAPSKTNKPIVERLRTAIAAQESGQDPSAINPDSSALGYGQIMPENIKEWSTQCLGSAISEDEFIKSKSKQIEIIDCKLTEYLEETKDAPSEDIQIRKVASMWYSGDPTLYDNPRPQTYGAGSYPSIKEYTETVLERFKKQ